jgi:hypothetical protein
VGTAHVKVNVVTRLRTSADPAEKRARVRRRYAIVLLSLGLIETAYEAWTYRSYMAAAPVYHASESCRMPTMDSLSSVGDGACRREFVVVVAARTTSGKGGTTHRLLTVSPDGTRDDASLFGPDSRAFFRRVKPTERLAVQRFVAPGYSLTGKVTAFADSAGSVLTRHHPDAGQRYHVVLAIAALAMTVVAAAVCLTTIKST